MTDTRILKIMARIPIFSHRAGHLNHRTGCGVFSPGLHRCTCDAEPVQLVTMDEVRKAMERFQQELVFNIPDPRKYEERGNALHAVYFNLVGDSGLEIRYAEDT